MVKRGIRRTIILCAVVALFSACLTVGAQQVSGARHPNLAQAQQLIERAMTRIDAAQQANEFDLGGHAAKAKDLLAQAYAEIKLAAVAANN